MSFFPSKSVAASLLLIGSVATFLLASQQQQQQTPLFARGLHDQMFKPDHNHDGGHDGGHGGGGVTQIPELEIWEGDWYGPYDHKEGEWRVFWIPMKGNTCCCRTWPRNVTGADTDLFMTSNPNYILDADWAGWTKAPENGAWETATITKNSNNWQCFAAVYGNVDVKRAGIFCDDPTVNRIDMDSKPDWA